ncbi:MAG: AAA family ATPase [Caldilineaceae bacterium]|nr:AAA family ATPase [Caldilineaceae bacterium]
MKFEDDLVGIFEIAEMAGVKSAAVANWRTRFDDFPAPIATLRSGPVFYRSHIRRWLHLRRGKMATVISTINLKGGVAKTTTTVAMAEILSAEFGKRVLVVDLDPQTNATVMLIGEQEWKNRNDNGHTLAQLFKDALEEDSNARRFDLSATLVNRVSNVRDVYSVDLLPSSLDLIEVQDRLASMPSGPYFANVPTDILRRAIRPIIDNYDYVLIDCPPNLGIITLNGLRISTGYVIPTIPDFLSTYGIPQIISRVEDFSQNIGEEIKVMGIIITKYRGQSSLHKNTVNSLRRDYKHVFKTVIPEATAIAASAEFAPISTLRQKYGYQGEFNRYRNLTSEIMNTTLNGAIS